MKMSDAVKKTKAAFKHIERAGKIIAATEATNHFKKSWKDQGFTDQTTEKWKEVKRRIPGTPQYKHGTRSSRRRAILVETGALRRSVQTIQRHQWPVVVGTRGLRYARKHNEGLGKLPQRQFIGYSRKLEKRTRKLLTTEINKALK